MSGLTGCFITCQVVELTADSAAAALPAGATGGAAGDVVGVPALVACRVKLVWEADAAAAAEVCMATQHFPASNRAVFASTLAVGLLPALPEVHLRINTGGEAVQTVQSNGCLAAA